MFDNALIETKQGVENDLAALTDLTSGPSNLYALLDACDESSVVQKINSLEKSQAASLYQGSAARDFYAIAPYVVAADQAFVDWIANNMLGRPWGYFLETDPLVTLPKIRSHLRRFMMAKGPGDKDLYFRFYDPRVVTIFLKSFSSETVSRFWGPIQSILLFDEDSQLVRLSPPETVSPSLDRSRFTVTESDLQNYVRHRDQGFRQRLKSHLTDFLQSHGQNVNQEQLDSQIIVGLERAKRYLLTKQSDIARYLELICFHVRSFEERGDPLPVQNILFDRRIKITERLDRLEDWAKQHSAVASVGETE